MHKLLNSIHTKLVLVIFIALISVTACQKRPSPANTEAATWQKNTKRWMAITEVSNGGYTEIPALPTRTPNLYNTHYALLTLASLNVQPEIEHLDATIKWLQTISKNGVFPDYIHSETGNNSNITSIYYGLSSITKLRGSINNPELFARTVSEYQQSNGTFLHNESDLKLEPNFANQRILNATHHALEAFHLLGMQPERISELHAWLQREWDQQIMSTEISPSSLHSLNLIALSLYRIAPNDPRLESAWNEIVRRVPLQQWSSYDRGLTLLALSPIVTTARVFDIAPDTWRDTVPLSLIESSQNHDGGFSGILEGASDMQGNGYAAHILNYFGSNNFDKQALATLVNYYAHHDGGYFTMWTAESHPPATWAVATLSSILQVPIDTASLQAHLLTEMQNTSDPRVIQLGLESTAVLGIEVPITTTLQTRILQMLERVSHDASYPIDHVASAAIASKYLDVMVPESLTKQIVDRYQSWRNVDNGYGPQNQSDEYITANILLIYYGLDYQPITKDATIQWLRQQQQGGFGSTNTPPNLRDTYTVMQVFARAEVQPVDIIGLQRWIATTLMPEGAVVITPLTETSEEPTFIELRWTAAAALVLQQTGISIRDTEALQNLLNMSVT